MRYSKAIGVLVAVGVVFCAGVGEGAWFMPLPQLPGAAQAGHAFAVSADGSTVVGTSHDGAAFQAVKWSVSGTIEKLDAGDFSYAWGVSADGSTIVGNNTSSEGYPLGFRWTNVTGSVLIGDFPGGEDASRAHDVSADGMIIVGGSATALGSEAFRWTASTGLTSIGDLPGGLVAGNARASSSNGSVVAGLGVSDRGIEAFRWTAESGMVGLGDLAGGGFFSEAYDVSMDGSIVVGRSAASDGRINYRAFRWTAETGMIALLDGNVNVGPTRTAEAISGDGTVIVGAAWGTDTAFAWDSFHGTRSIRELLAAQGVDLAGWDLQIASGVSLDGTTIVGLGVNPDGLQQPWMARLDAGTFIPEPSSIALSAAGFVAWLASLRVLSRAA